MHTDFYVLLISRNTPGEGNVSLGRRKLSTPPCPGRDLIDMIGNGWSFLISCHATCLRLAPKHPGLLFFIRQLPCLL